MGLFMDKIEKSKMLNNKIKKIASKKLNLLNILRLFNIFMKIGKEECLKYVKVFIKEYYCLKEEMPEDFYDLILNRLFSDSYLLLFDILVERNIYSLISYLKYECEDISLLEDEITPLQYYIIPRKYINKLVEKLKELDNRDEDNYLDTLLKDEPLWLLKRRPCLSETEYKIIAYKIYFSIGLDNGLELLSKKYGEIDYERIYFLFSKLNVKNQNDSDFQQNFNNFLFESKRDSNNIIRQMLRGDFKELFLNFDYFYNRFNYFVCKLGTKMTRSKVKTLLEERYLPKNVLVPEITGDILDDMLASYYCKYDFLDTPLEDIHNKNFEAYNKYLRRKYKSSIPKIEFTGKEPFFCEVLSLSDPRNLVLGYRAGNCFRINGDASILFDNFLRSEHMRLLSISTLDNNDFAMMLIMRNGNVLIGQGIEASKWAPSSIKGKKLYDVCKEVLKEMMDYMNSCGDEIVATIIGSSNSNVSEYNNQVLPFLINPILEDSGNYYNGIYNYQCLLDISEGKSLQDIKLYIPSVRYLDKRDSVLRRKKNVYDNNYREIEKRLIALRFLRMKRDGNFDFYEKLSNHKELYTCCNKDWYITLFDDGTIDGFVSDGDERAQEEYNSELDRIQEYILKNKGRKPFSLRHTNKGMNSRFRCFNKK